MTPAPHTPRLPAIAVIADAHFHDIDSDYDFAPTPFKGKSGTLRSWTDTRRSSRVFNESGAALKSALANIEQCGIRHVVMLGDYTDDGQVEATQRISGLLRQYRDSYGIQFYVIPGNHECYGPAGKHQSTRFVSTPGETVVVTSDPEVAAAQGSGAILTRKMFCEGMAAALLPVSEFGLLNQPEYLHWESPFGLDDAFDSRLYQAHSPDGATVNALMDASYLVEPAEGLWLLMLDANVFEPRNGQGDISRKKAFLDSSDAGWNSVLRNKAYLLNWISEVCTRARQQGKTLIAFSHYPVMDPFDDWSDSETRLFGNTETLRRRPNKQVALTLLQAGVQLHLGGHLHVNALSRTEHDGGQLTDIAVPSLAAFPPAYKTLHPATDHCRIDTISLNPMPLDPWLLDYYRAECTASNRAQDDTLSARNHGEFLYRRMVSRVTQHFLPRDWPDDIVRQLHGRNTVDLACFLIARRDSSTAMSIGELPPAILASARSELELLTRASGLSIATLTACSMTDLIVDWYSLRQAGHQAGSFFPLESLNLYLFLAQEFGEIQSTDSDPMVAFLATFLGVLHLALQRLNPAGMMTDIIDWQP